MSGIHTFYAPVNGKGQFMFAALREKKRDVKLSDSERKYGELAIKAVSMTIQQGATPLLDCDADDWAETHAGWIIQNPDDSFWMDTLAVSEAETRAWWGDADRAAKREALGFKVVRVQLEIE